MAKFIQIEPEDFEVGPYWIIAGLKPLPDEIRTRCGIKFHEFMEDLGLKDFAFIELPDGARYMLQRYRDSPGPGTEVWGIEDVPDMKHAIVTLVEAIGLKQTDIFWIVEKKFSEW